MSRPWLKDHPHTRPGWDDTNCLYVAANELTLGGQPLPLPGCGILNPGYRLTLAGANPSMWRVPDWLHPLRGGSGMTYHPGTRWNADGTVRAAARGQEFVADIKDDTQAIGWLTALFAGSLGSRNLKSMRDQDRRSGILSDRVAAL